MFRACDLAMAGAVDAVVTAPLNKAAMHAAGHTFPGHTELLAERTGATRVSMLLIGPSLRVVHVSTHVALAEAIRRVTRQRVDEVIEIAYESCRMLGIAEPRIAVAGLNPHASEGGLFGDEEAREVIPAIEERAGAGRNVSDPQPPDTVFLRATKGDYDIVVAMYHDQGHIPMKLLAFDSGVNVSIGLPIIRTSVDHGTAFDIAGTGEATRGACWPRSMSRSRWRRRNRHDREGVQTVVRLAILADDLTGAADAGGGFAGLGLATTLVFGDRPAEEATCWCAPPAAAGYRWPTRSR